ncbi:hypothetical protein [Actinoplanes auranticolor]|uniref:Uncharacterized protein n=1 Tax=Actinoplanes auranticolor TaxID=47988 RepID=A0A919S988_9ACTN|nr:hypothetical protein Aau02nite_21400 [Actinoplanes auranticolor]
MAPIRTAVQAADPLTRAGLTGLLRSSREVKVVFALTQRLALRNRSHAVAYAVRAGLV